MSKKAVRLVAIQNPHPGGKRYTTVKCAVSYVRRGWAEWGSERRAIRFIECEARIHGHRLATVRQVEKEQRDREQDRAVANWSGTRNNPRLYEPGEVRS